ncbi:PAS domain-containing protein [Sphingobium sufflavum]|uniref:PAS domain-containing protein n=1 Tax=Sphingobium sufflavum TaxID=1129547 RepID=UPI001F34B184|nr:PAS domain-containing protein [Sphingobium sufflavum]MCE7797723.1 PAS domain-containing protein [Sphingobium sufflavum]
MAFSIGKPEGVALLSETEAARILGLDLGRLPGWTQGLLITDAAQPDNPIIFASRGFATLTGYTTDEAEGRNCRFLQGVETDPRTVAAMRDAVAARRRFDGEVLNYRKDGRPFWNQLSIGPLDTSTDSLFVGLQFDVTLRHRGA